MKARVRRVAGLFVVLLVGLLHSHGAAATMVRASTATAPTGPLVFVSLSMPAASLQHLAHWVPAVGGVLVLRGLPANTLSGLASTLREIGIRPDALIIDPPLFHHYAVTAVPTFVFPLSGTEHVAFQGDVTRAGLRQALAQALAANPSPAHRAWVARLTAPDKSAGSATDTAVRP